MNEVRLQSDLKILMRTNSLICFLFIYSFIEFSRATPVAHGGSQARGPIGAAAASLCHSNVGSELCL